MFWMVTVSEGNDRRIDFNSCYLGYSMTYLLGCIIARACANDEIFLGMWMQQQGNIVLRQAIQLGKIIIAMGRIRLTQINNALVKRVIDGQDISTTSSVIGAFEDIQFLVRGPNDFSRARSASSRHRQYDGPD